MNDDVVKGAMLDESGGVPETARYLVPVEVEVLADAGVDATLLATAVRMAVEGSTASDAIGTALAGSTIGETVREVRLKPWPGPFTPAPGGPVPERGRTVKDYTVVGLWKDNHQPYVDHILNAQSVEQAIEQGEVRGRVAVVAVFEGLHVAADHIERVEL